MPINQEDISTFHGLIKESKYEVLDSMLSRPQLSAFDINILINSIHEGRTALSLACGRADIQKTYWLLKRGASVDIKDSDGTYPIHRTLSADKFEPKILDLLVEKLMLLSEEDRTQVDSSGASALFYAMGIPIIEDRILWTSIFMKIGIDAQAGDGMLSPLIASLSLSAESRSRDVVKLLLQGVGTTNKADIFESAKGIGNSLFMAVSNNWIEGAWLIIQEAIKERSLEALIQNNEYGKNLMDIARQNMDLDQCQWLIRNMVIDYRPIDDKSDAGYAGICNQSDDSDS